MQERSVAEHEYEWSKQRDRDMWTLHMFPFYLVLERRPGQPLPFVGSIRGALYTLKDCRSWDTVENAAVGMLEWGLEELTKSYHELLRLRGGGQQETQQTTEVGK